MRVIYESLCGPQRCRVVKELAGGFVRLLPLSVPAGAFGGVEPCMREFEADKHLCWARVVPLGKYGVRFQYVGRPSWNLQV